MTESQTGFNDTLKRMGFDEPTIAKINCTIIKGSMDKYHRAIEEGKKEFLEEVYKEKYSYRDVKTVTYDEILKIVSRIAPPECVEVDSIYMLRGICNALNVEYTKSNMTSMVDRLSKLNREGKIEKKGVKCKVENVTSLRVAYYLTKTGCSKCASLNHYKNGLCKSCYNLGQELHWAKARYDHLRAQWDRVPAIQQF